MVVDTVNILKLIFPNLHPDEYNDNEDVNNYLAEIGNSTADIIIKEPEKLEEQRQQLLEHTQELTFSNYKTFIETAECSKEIFKRFGETETEVQALISNLPDFNKNCHVLSEVSSEVNSQRKLNSVVLSKHSQLLEILELPQLMEDCIKNAYFEEALELASYVKRLGKKHGDISIIASIVQEFDGFWLIMLQQLLAQLRTDLQLPKCLQIVGYLRRMEMFSEAELRLKFLQARDSWLQQLLASIAQDEGNQGVLKLIEMYRIHLFNIITQYRAIFSDEESVIPNTTSVNVNETSIFYSWINEKISQLISTIDKYDLSKHGSSLDSIMGQCMYFGLSFSRVGADFRALLAPKFVQIIQQNFSHRIRKANKTFDSDMEKFVIKKTPIQTKLRQTDKPEHPPNCLVEFHPLANYTNGILNAFNELRSCLPLSCADFITSLIQDSLKSCSKTILNLYRQEEPSFDQVEKENFTKLCGAFQIMVGYLQKCIHLLFPNQVLANHLGILVHQLQKDGLTYLNESSILDNLNHLMPIDVYIPEAEVSKIILGEDVSIS